MGSVNIYSDLLLSCRQHGVHRIFVSYLLLDRLFQSEHLCCYINGNLNSDSRENLRLTYNFGNLQTAVYKGSSSTPIIEVTRFADGTKESVIAAGKGRWLYRGKFVYKVLSNNQLVLESGEHDHGRFIAKAEVAYCDEFLDTWHVRDYLGSIRAVYDITETAVGNPIDAVLEQNDYYAFRCRIETPDLPKMAANRYGYNGKETLQRSEHITLDHS